jgi:hypothetical protein
MVGPAGQASCCLQLRPRCHQVSAHGALAAKKCSQINAWPAPPRFVRRVCGCPGPPESPPAPHKNTCCHGSVCEPPGCLCCQGRPAMAMAPAAPAPRGLPATSAGRGQVCRAGCSAATSARTHPTAPTHTGCCQAQARQASHTRPKLMPGRRSNASRRRRLAAALRRTARSPAEHTVGL